VLLEQKKGSPALGFNTGIPCVGISDTAPIPAYTVPAAGAGTYRTVINAVSYETRGANGTRGFVCSYSPCNLMRAAHTSIDVARIFREVVLGYGWSRGWRAAYRDAAALPVSEHTLPTPSSHSSDNRGACT
jgi:hypothetical protein